MEIYISIFFLVSLFVIIEMQLRKEKKKRAKYFAAEKKLVEQFNAFNKESKARFNVSHETFEVSPRAKSYAAWF